MSCPWNSTSRPRADGGHTAIGTQGISAATDSTGSSSSLRRVTGRHAVIRGMMIAVAAFGLSTLCGCSLFVLAGKMIWGDPVVPSDFRLRTGVNLAKEKKKLLVVCTTPESIKAELPSLQLDLTEAIHRNLRRHDVPVVDSDRVANWIDESGGFFADLTELAEQFDPDYIAQIEVERLTFREENSPAMYRGRANGSVYVYEVVREGDTRRTFQVFVKEFRVEYPRHYPVSADQMSLKVFQRRFLDELSGTLSRMFYDYRPGEDI
ncbi:MAG: hypothetical protein GXP27_00710 [Planctomycetes bacterium]|nr:hypothetical protein [Planctomycetota bacterium]